MNRPDISGPDTHVLAAEFPVQDNWLWANHAAISPWPSTTRRVVEAFARDNHLNGAASYLEWLAMDGELRDRLARLIGAGTSDDISLLPNTTEGINLVARGLDWKHGDNLVTTADEFPSNQMAWFALEQQGVELRRIDVRAAEDAELALLEAMDDRTRVLALSSVQWTDGFRLQLGRLGPACRERGVLFFVDAIQQLGALRLFVERDQVDVLVAGSHKWQMGPEGLALCYTRAAIRQQLKPLKVGWRMLEEPFLFDQPDRQPQRNGKRFETGSPNTLGQFALNASLSLHDRFGADWIEQRILDNTAQLIDGLNAMSGVQLVTREEQERRSGIVAVKPERQKAKTLERALMERRVTTIARGEWLRISPHYYQGKDMMDRLLNALELAVNSN